MLGAAAGTLKRLTLELGGNDAALVLDDADPEWAAERIFVSAMINAGQVCYAAKRVYAPRRLFDAVAGTLARRAAAAVLGDGLDPATTMGPLQNRMQYEKVLEFIASARAEGGTFLTGGEPTGQGYFIRPAIVTGLPDNARLVREEQFGPVLPVQVYDDLDDAIAQANDTEYGSGRHRLDQRRPPRHRDRRPHRDGHDLGQPAYVAALRRSLRRRQTVGHRPAERQGGT